MMSIAVPGGNGEMIHIAAARTDQVAVLRDFVSEHRLQHPCDRTTVTAPGGFRPHPTPRRRVKEDLVVVHQLAGTARFGLTMQIAFQPVVEQLPR